MTQPHSITKLSQSKAFLHRTAFGSQPLFLIKSRQSPSFSPDQFSILNNRKTSMQNPHEISRTFQSPVNAKEGNITLPHPVLNSPVLSRRATKQNLATPNHFLFSPKQPKTSFSNKSTRFDNTSPPNYPSQRLSRPQIKEWDPVEEKGINSLVSHKEIDLTSEEFLVKLLGRFAGPQKERVTTTIVIGRTPKNVSIRYAHLVLQSLVDNLKAVKVSKNKHHSMIVDEIESPEVILEKFYHAINQLSRLCRDALSDRGYKNLLDGHIKKMAATAQQTSNLELQLYSMYLLGKVYMARCDFRDGITEFRRFKDLCVSHKAYGRRVEAYKNLGKCYQGLKFHKTALVYFTKFLYVAWEIDMPKAELLAYDYIGMQYYYMGQLEKAEFFHNKMVGGKVEAKTSRLRQIGIIKIRLNKGNGYAGKKGYEFDSDFEMGMGWEQGMTDDGTQDEAAGEISHRDEGFEPPSSNLEEEMENRRTLEMIKRNQRDLMRSSRDVHRPITLKTIPGFMKARVMLQKKLDGDERKKKAPMFAKNNESGDSDLQKITLTRPIRNGTANSFLTGRPNEQIFTSHLSRNRGLKNFAYLGPPMFDENGVNDELDSKSSELIRKVLEKFKANLEVIKETVLAAYPVLKVGN